MKILISFPTNRDWKPVFGCSLVGLIAHLYKGGIDHKIVPWLNCSNIAKGRNEICEYLLSESFSHLLTIDDDMGFDAPAFDLMLSRNTDFVAANYLKRISYRSLKIANKTSSVAIGIDGKPIYSSKRTGIEEVSSIGFGFVLMKSKCLENLKKPYFRMTPYLNEDAYFCNLLRKGGIIPYVDHDASRHVVHICDSHLQENFQ